MTISTPQTSSANNVPRRSSAQPFFMQAGPIGVLLIHGYSGVPGELGLMGSALAAAGYTVAGPLLAGHGGVPADLHKVRWQDWAASAEQALEQIHEHCTTVFVVGFSMGALLALHLAAHRQIAGVIAIAPALRLFGEKQLRLTGLLKYVVTWYRPLARANFSDPAVRKNVRQWLPDINFNDPAIIAQLKRDVRIPVDSLYELVRLQDAVLRDLPQVTVPVLLMQGRNDKTVKPRSVTEIAQRIGSKDQRTVWFERSGHMLPLEAECEAVWATAVEWLGQHATEVRR